MNILIICYEYPPLGGGGSKVVAGLARQFVQDGHKVSIFTSGWAGLPQTESIGGSRIYRVNTIRSKKDRANPIELAYYLIKMFVLVLRHIKRHNYDVCNCHFIFPDGVLSYVLRRWAKIPVVITAHGSDVPGYNPERFTFLHQLLYPIWRRIVNSPLLIVCPSNTLRSLINSQETTARTCVIPNGFDLDRFNPNGNRQNRVLVVSRLFSRKGVQDLIQAYSQTTGNFKLHIVGDGPSRPELESLARNTKRSQDIIFHGWLDNNTSELKDLYESSAIFVLPSYAENFPVSLLEAMAAGSTIITTQGTGCEDVTGDTALLFRPGDIDNLTVALQRLMNEPELRRELSEAARTRLEGNYAWPRVARAYIQAFNRECLQAESFYAREC